MKIEDKTDFSITRGIGDMAVFHVMLLIITLLNLVNLTHYRHIVGCRQQLDNTCTSTVDSVVKWNT